MSAAFREDEAAKYIGMSKAFLQKDRLVGATIPYLKIGRAVRYARTDLDAYLESRRVGSTQLARK